MQWLCVSVNPYIRHTAHQFPTHFLHSSNRHRLHTAAVIWSCPKWEQVCLSVWCHTVNEWESRLPKLLRRQCNCWGGLNHPVSCEYKALLALCSLFTRIDTTHTNSHKHTQTKSTNTKSLIKAKNKSWVYVSSVLNKKIQQLFCIVLLFIVIFSKDLFITLHASFCTAAFGGQGACLSWYHSSIIFPAGSQGPVEREEKREVGSLQSPLCGPWRHLLMRDATQTLTRSLLADLPSSLSSSLPLSTALSSCRQSTQAVH